MAPRPAELASWPIEEDALDGLLAELRDAGFAIGLREHLQALELAEICRRSGGSFDPLRLRNWLAPVLCNRAEEQEAFYARFEAWWRRRSPEPVTQPPEPSELEGDLEQMRPWRWLALLAGLVTLAAAALYSGYEWLHEGDLVEVPAVTGQTRAAALTSLEATRLAGRIEQGRLASTLPEGMVARQVPKAGETLKPGAEVRLWLARPLEPVAVPSVVGLALEESIARLARLGLEVVTQEGVPSDRPEGAVLVQQPEAGERVEPGPVMRLWFAEPVRSSELVQVTGRLTDLEGRAVRGGVVWIGDREKGTRGVFKVIDEARFFDALDEIHHRNKGAYLYSLRDSFDVARKTFFAASNDTGGFLVEAKPDARAQAFYVYHEDFHLPAACELPMAPGKLLVEARLALRGTTWTRWLDHHRDELGYGLALVPLLAAGSWWGWKRRRRRVVLERRASREVDELAGIRLPEPRHGLFRGHRFLRARIEARRRYAAGPGDLDADRTVESSVRRMGYFTPVYRSRLRLPVYLALVDRVSFGDQQARLVDELLDRLVDGGVEVDRYTFDLDPRLCASADHPALHRRSLRELAGLHPEHRLLIFGDGAGLFDPVSGRLAGWTGQLAAWKERALLTPIPACHGSARELELAATGLRVLPASPEGLLRFAEPPQSLDAETAADWRPPLPELFSERPERWLDRNPPEPEAVEELRRQLRLYLDPDGYRWLCALAVYPELDWYLTLYLGLRLCRVDGTPLLGEEALLGLTRLPWLRHGSIPDWLRLELIRDLSDDDEETVRRFLYDLLRSPLEAPESRFALDVARPAKETERGGWRWFFQDVLRTEPRDSLLQDRVFVDFLMGKRPRQLQLLAPAAWRRWVWERGMRSLGLRPVAGLCAAAAVAAAAFFGAPAAIGLLHDIASTGEASTITCNWNAARVLVPELRGLTRQQAEATLNTAGLTTAVTGDDHPEAVVMDQDPPPATPVAVGSEVRLAVQERTGTVEKVFVPQLVGLDVGTARKFLEQVGLGLRTDDPRLAEIGGYESFLVIRQRPRQASQVAPGTEVIVVLKSEIGGPPPTEAATDPGRLPATAEPDTPQSGSGSPLVQFVHVEGLVEYQTFGEARWRPARRGVGLTVGDLVRTGKSAASAALEILASGNRIDLGSDTTIQIGPAGSSVEVLAGTLDVLIDQPSEPMSCVETGPIADDEDARRRCEVACKPIGPWTGDWWTAEVGKSSVCRCRVDEALLDELPFDRELGIEDCAQLCRTNRRYGGVLSPSKGSCICSSVPLDCPGTGITVGGGGVVLGNRA